MQTDVSILGGGVTPPDPTIAVGPSHVVEFVNVVGGVWSKGGSLVQQFSLNSFFGLSSSSDLTDPQVIYDTQSSRWYATVADIVTGYVYYAYSSSSDPTARWSVNHVAPPVGDCADQPYLGVSDDKLVFSVNLFDCATGNNYLGVEYWVINKAELAAGVVNPDYCFHSPDLSVYSSVYPAQSLSSTSSEYMVGLDSYGVSAAQVWRLDGVPTSTGCNTFTHSNVSKGSTHLPPSAPQLGASYLLDTGDARVTSAFWYLGNLWYAYNDGETPPGDTAARAVIVIDEIATSSNTMLQDYFYSNPGEYYYYPALRVNGQGNLVVAFAYSSSGEYPGVAVLTFLSGAPRGTYFNLNVLHQGSGPEGSGTGSCLTANGCRYGDYFGASTDPSSASSIWIAAEFGTNSRWSTYISNLNPGAPNGVTPLTIAYSVQGGGFGYGRPVLHVTVGGTQYGYSLSTTAFAYYADVGTTWSVDSSLSGSTSTERWATGQAVTATVSSPFTQTFVYNHQYGILASYSLSGGGSPSPPSITYTSFGLTASTPISTTAQTLWADSGSTFSTLGTLASSTATERWITNQGTGGTANNGVTLALVYYHQFLLSVSYSVLGSGSPPPPSLSYASLGSSSTIQVSQAVQSFFADAGTRYAATNPLSGSTSTERWYSAQGNGTVSAAGALALSYHHQYLLTLVGVATASQWLDEGFIFSVSSPEVYNRANGAGLRISAVSLDGGAVQKEPLTTGNITIAVTMNAPHTLTITIVSQYQVSLDASATKAINSLTTPTIPGDNYWYDSGTPVSLLLNGIFGRASGTGSRLLSYSVNGGAAVSVTSTGAVNALALGSINSPQSVTANSVTQYQLSTPTGSVTSTTAPTITGDIGWYDSGTAVTISYNYLWNVVPQQSRLAATGYSVDGGAATGVAKGSTGTFSVALAMGAAHSVDVKYVTQFYISFQFSDAAGKRTIVPSALQISIGSQAQPVPGFTIWLDNGTSFTIASVTYEGVDVKPTAAQTYNVSAAAAINLKDNVYDATVKVNDFLGLPVSGADVKMTLANGTLVSGSTSGDGTFTAPAIPLGTFTATVSAIGSSTQVTGDASKQAVTSAPVLFSTTSLGLIVAIVVVVAGLAVFMLRRRSGKAPARPAAPAQMASSPARLTCPNCGSAVEQSEPFCPNCGTKLR